MIKTFENFNNDGILKVSEDKYGWSCKFSCEFGKGRALLFNRKEFKFKIDDELIPIKLGDDEMFLFGIEVTPQNKGVGKLFLNKIFDYFNLEKIYLPSDEDHPVWNKIATKTNMIIEMGSKDSRIFTIDKNQIMIKKFENFNEIDPYGEEEWEDLKIGDKITPKDNINHHYCLTSDIKKTDFFTKGIEYEIKGVENQKFPSGYVDVFITMDNKNREHVLRIEPYFNKYFIKL